MEGLIFILSHAVGTSIVSHAHVVWHMTQSFLSRLPDELNKWNAWIMKLVLTSNCVNLAEQELLKRDGCS